MERYINSTGDSTITHYEIGDDYIRILCKKTLREYNVSQNSIERIEEMKLLAKGGTGLYRFIRKNKLQAIETVQKARTGIFHRLKMILSII